MDSAEDVSELKDELIDRFGDYPVEVSNLFTVSSLKMYAKRERVESITERNKKIVILVDDARSQQIDGSKVFEVANTFGRNVGLGTESNKLKIAFKWTSETEHSRYDLVEEFIKKLNSVNRDK